jgi:hypothetical protein
LELLVGSVLVNQVANVFLECAKICSFQHRLGFCEKDLGVTYQETAASVGKAPIHGRSRGGQYAMNVPDTCLAHVHIHAKALTARHIASHLVVYPFGSLFYYRERQKTSALKRKI